jgi:hypothetical protein
VAKSAGCGCQIINGTVARPCLTHVRWHRVRAQPLRKLLQQAVPDDKTDPIRWAQRREHEFKIIDTEN